MHTLVIGIDPGLTGAMALFTNGVLTDIVDMPIDEHVARRSGAELRDLIGGRKESKRRSINVAALVTRLRTWTDGHSALIVKEKMSTRPNQNNTTLMKLDGILTGVIGGIGIEMQEVEPAKWKLAMGVPADKEKARQAAITLFPAWKGLLNRKMDHNRAEAALIGLYGIRHAVR